MYGDYPNVQKRNRAEDLAITVYIVDDNKPNLDKISCMFCKRTICDFKGRVDRIVDVPIDARDFGVAVNIRCKLCHQNYRFVMNPHITGVQSQLDCVRIQVRAKSGR